MPGRGVVIAPPPEKIVPRRGNNYLRVALRIAERLSREAIWHEDRCNWLGFGPDKASGISGGRQFSALGPDLYGGTSGVAIFLAEAHAVAEDLSIQRAALGAMCQALSTSDQVPADVRPGLYSGWTGIAYAGVRVGRLLGEDAMVRRAVDLLGRLRRERMQRWDFDLMSGRSGAITGILAIRDRVEGDWVTGFALRLGKELHRTADRTDRGWSWKSVLVPHPRNLTGLSHGAAGAGHALSELAHATGDSRCRQAAEGAFEYERRWFDPEAGNWPDFREEPGYLNRRRPPYAFTCTWCHGAAGIALTRLRAYELWKDPACRAEALAALKTTRDSLQRPEEFGSGNYSLCHGLAGNGEVLMYGSRVMGKEASDALSSAQEVAEAGVKSYADPDRPWPCGSGVGETPGLMLGLAGIGHFYLTMNSPETPSVLLLRPWDFSGKRSRG
jgi:lantibiotic modifying enzyme